MKRIKIFENFLTEDERFKHSVSEKKDQKSESELSFGDLEDMLKNKEIVWQTTPYYGNESGVWNFIHKMFKDGEGVIYLHPPKDSSLIEKDGNKIWVTMKKDGELKRFFVNDVSEAVYDRLFKKYGYKH